MNSLLNKLVLGSSVTALCATAPLSAAVAQDNGDIEQVVVSASRITIAGYTQPTPVTVVGAAQLAQDAYADIADSLRELPEVETPPSSFGLNSAGGLAGEGGANLIDLRALGGLRTLVLFDGQRAVVSELHSSVDVTLVPTAVISRVDIVTGGASASWGSDAVAGVVNFVLNKNYNGFKATLQATDTSNGLARSFSGDAAWGGDIEGGRGHIELAVNVKISPDFVILSQENWFKNSYFVSNPTYAPGNGQPQLIVANNVGLATSTLGGLITASPAGTTAAANALRGIEFTGAGVPSIVNFGNVTLGSTSNGGSLTESDGYANTATIANPNNNYTFFGYGRYKLTDTIQAAFQLNYSYITGKGLSGSAQQTGLVIRSDNAYVPASVAASMAAGGITSFTLGSLGINNYNLGSVTGANFSAQAEPSLGPGVVLNDRSTTRGVFSLDGTLGDDWSWNAYAEHGQVHFISTTTGFPILANLAAAEDAVTVTSANVGKTGLALGSIACRNTLTGATVTVGTINALPGCIPLDVFGTGVASPAAIGYVTGVSNNMADQQHESVRQDVLEGSMQGILPWQLPAGKVAVAFGAGYRKEFGVTRGTTIGTAGGYSGVNIANFPAAYYDVIEGFGEVNAPILKNDIVNSLDFTMAGRMTSYSTSGLVETWKLGATSQVNDDVKLRTTWSVDIRAPNLNELFAAGGASAAQSLRDPKTQATVVAHTITGGNANLVPEIARTISGGVVLTPTFIPGLSLSADWYAISLTGVISTLNMNTILTQCNATQPSPVYPGQNGNPNDPLCSNLVFGGTNGALSAISVTEINVAHQTTSGLDLQADYTMDFWEGTLAWASTDSYNDEYTTTQPGSGISDVAGSNGQTGGNGFAFQPGPKWKGIVSATYNGGPYTFTVQSRWFGTSVTYQNGNTGNQATAATANLYDPAHFETPATAYLDLRGTYKWNDNISFYGAIDNTLNTPPPLVPATSSIAAISSINLVDTNSTVYDMFGRVIRVGIRLNY